MQEVAPIRVRRGTGALARVEGRFVTGDGFCVKKPRLEAEAFPADNKNARAA